jgi:hypothetical protein
VDEPDSNLDPMGDDDERRKSDPDWVLRERRRRMLLQDVNRFFLPPGEGSGERGSGKVMAAIEVPDAADEGAPEENDYEEPTYFECVGLEWYRQQSSASSWLQVDQNAPLSVLELTTSPRPQFSDNDQPGDIAWFYYSYVHSSAGEADARLYTSLYGAGAPVRITSNERIAAPVDGPMSKAGLVSTDRVGLSDIEGLVRGLVPKFRSTAGVAVYDVGQGACQAMVDKDRLLPLVYFDFGGGVLYNVWTFPKDTAGFCFTQKPPVILSHWDWDHWSSAYRFPEVLQTDWLTPPVPATPLQQSMAAALRRRNRLHVWSAPPGSVVRLPALRIERCTGKTSNDSGLAVTVYSGATGRRNCLLPGDASYRYIPSVVAGEQFSALCMSHHGGRLHSRHYPIAKSRAIAANSAGPRNSYKHPLLSTVAAHLDARWPVPATTGFSNQRPCHVLLPWGKQPHLFRGGCHGTMCSAIPAQTAPRSASIPLARHFTAAEKSALARARSMAGVGS